MIKQLLIICILLIGGLNTSNKSNGNSRQNNGNMVRTQMRNGIVPDVIDIAPRKKVEVHYKNGEDVEFGNRLTPNSVEDEPEVDWPTEEGEYYTLVMTDPDVPNRRNPFNGEYKHWLVINIPENDVSNGLTLTPYMGSHPPKGSGYHRYIFLVFKQPSLFKVLRGRNGEIQDRSHFKVRKFAKQYKLGQPIAANFFLSKSDRSSKRRKNRSNKRGK